jgi:hypothetical protein
MFIPACKRVADDMRLHTLSLNLHKLAWCFFSGCYQLLSVVCLMLCRVVSCRVVSVLCDFHILQTQLHARMETCNLRIMQ